MIIFTYHDGGNSQAFATKKEAIDAAREASENDPDYEYEVYRETVVPLTKANFLAIINSNGGQYVQEHRIIAVFKNGRLTNMD